MDKRTKTGIITGILSLLAALSIFQSGVTSQKSVSETFIFRTMGTVAKFTFEEPDSDLRRKDCENARREFDRILDVANLYNKNSELSRLNASAYKKEFICSDLLWKMILEAETAFYFSDGAFDITVKPLMDVWVFYRRKGSIPSDKEIKEALKKVGFQKLILDKKRKSVRFTVPGMALDLGGIAKGFALDLAAEKIVSTNRGVLDLGGNLKFLGSGKNYRVGIKDPSSPDKLSQHILEIAPGSAVSTSGDYERKVIYNGRSYGHIIDPVTGYPADSRFSATAAVPSAMRADWLSTAVFLRGEL